MQPSLHFQYITVSKFSPYVLWHIPYKYAESRVNKAKQNFATYANANALS